MKNARLWVFIDNDKPAWVKITLKPQQSLTWKYKWDHSKGWTEERLTWTHAGTVVRKTAKYTMQDLYGVRREQRNESETSIEELQVLAAIDQFNEILFIDGSVVMIPQWEPAERQTEAALWQSSK